MTILENKGIRFSMGEPIRFPPWENAPKETKEESERKDRLWIGRLQRMAVDEVRRLGVET